MSLIARNVNIPIFLKVGNDLLPSLRKLVLDHQVWFGKPLIIGDTFSIPLGQETFAEQWKEAGFFTLDHNTDAECDRAMAMVDQDGYDSIIGFGGGRSLDVGKMVATKRRLNYVSVPTTPSNDGIASPVAVIKDDAGLSHSLGVKMPAGIVVDLSILAGAPKRNILAGTGDLISNISAGKDWRLGAEDTGEKIDDYALILAEQSATMLRDYLERGEEISSDKYLTVLVQGLILSGIAMNIAGNSRPASGAEHEFSHAIDRLFPEKGGFHGTQVAYGTLIAEKIRGEDVSKLKEAFVRVGLPTTPEHLGLTYEEAAEALHYAPQTRPNRYTILEKKNLTKEQCLEVLKDL